MGPAYAIISPSGGSRLRDHFQLAEAAAPVSFEILSPSPVEVEPLLDEAYRVEAAGWKGERGTALERFTDGLHTIEGHRG